MDSPVQNLETAGSNRVFILHVLKKIFLEDWLMKLVALGISLGLWVGVTGLSETGSDRYTVPLSIRVAETSEITSDPSPQVEVRVSGDKRRLGQIRERDLRFSIDLTDLPPGDHIVNLSPSNVTAYDLPTGVRLEDIQPNRINVKLEAVATKEVPVKVRTRGELADGFEMATEPIAAPARIRVRGPASVIEELTEISTEIVDIADKKAEFSERGVSLTAGSNTRISLMEAVVDVRFPIREIRSERVFLVPVEGLFDRKATVVLFGPRSILNSLKPDQVKTTAGKDTNGEDIATVSLPADVQNSIEIRQARLRP